MDKRAEFISLIDKHQSLINKVVFLYVDGTEDRRDLRQEIISQAWGSFKSFRGEAKFSTWLYRVAMNVAIATIRKTIKERSAELPKPSPVEAFTNEKDLLNIILNVLSPVEKSIVILQIEGYGQPEIAEILGISEGNTRIKIHRIRKKLKDYGIDKLA